MSAVVVAVGLLILAIGLVILVAPRALTATLMSMLMRPSSFYLAALFRIAIGVLMLLAAGQTRAPTLIRVLGILVILAGLALPVVGQDRVRALAVWWTESGDGVIRLWAVFSMAFGALLVWAGW